MKLEQRITTLNPCYTANTKIQVKGIMLHSVGTAQSKASAFYSAFNSPSVNKAVHAFVQNDGYVMQTLPWNVRAWHCGGNGNSNYIGVEMTEPSTIKYTGGSNFIDLNPTATANFVMGTFNTAAELFAVLCKMYGLNPLGNRVIICHQDGYRLGLASNHSDVYHIWNKYGITMDMFRNQVLNYMNIGVSTTPVTSTPSTTTTTPKKNYIARAILEPGDVLNIRAEANNTSAVLGQLRNNQLAYVKSEQGKWLKLAQGGYIYKKYTQEFNNGYKYKPNRYSVLVNVERLNIRSTPVIAADNIVGHANIGKYYTVIATHEDFGLLLSGAGNINLDPKYVSLTPL